MSDIDILKQLSNLKEIDYKNTLALTAIIELLFEKGVISKKELKIKINELENIALTAEDR